LDLGTPLLPKHWISLRNSLVWIVQEGSAAKTAAEIKLLELATSNNLSLRKGEAKIPLKNVFH